MTEKLHPVIVQTAHSGDLTVYVQGEIDDIPHKTVFLTVHDVGTNYESFVRFVNDPSMAEVKKNAVFLHVSLPGQEEGAPDLDDDAFPNLQVLAEDLLYVLVKFNVRNCVAFGDGAGANIVCRLAMSSPSHILAIILVHCTSTTAGVVECFKTSWLDFFLESGLMSESAWESLIFHKFGKADNAATQEYIENLKEKQNLRNLGKFLYSFMERSDISELIPADLKVDALLVAGSKAPHLHTVHTTCEQMNKKTTTLLVVDDISDVMTEAPDHLARSLILFCKGCGVLSGVHIPGMERQRTLSNSMEEADLPRRNSLGKKSADKK